MSYYYHNRSRAIWHTIRQSGPEHFPDLEQLKSQDQNMFLTFRKNDLKTLKLFPFVHFCSAVVPFCLEVVSFLLGSGELY